MPKFVRKSDSWWMRILVEVLGSRFASHYWTTIGDTIYYPIKVHDPHHPRHAQTVKHEMHHIRQFERFGIPLMMLFYLLLPLPVFFSGRWFLERYAYLDDIIAGVISEEKAAKTLWEGYLMPWPKSWMLSWFEKKLDERGR